jgi:hypothetical protein
MLGLRAGVGGEQLLGLIQRQHQPGCRAVLAGATPQLKTQPRASALGEIEKEEIE